MDTDSIKVLEKTQINKGRKHDLITTGCCGGAPVSNEEACCKLDEAKKAEGESGCGCSTTTTNTSSGCC